MANNTGRGPGNSSGSQRGLSEELFGPGSLGKALNRASTRNRAEPSTRRPVWVRLAALTTTTGAGTWAIGDLLPLLPPGGSRDALRTALEEALTYGPSATGILGGCTACALGLWWRSPIRQRAPRSTPSAADRAAATALKLRPDTLRVTLSRRAKPKWSRPLKKVTVTYPAGAITQDPSRSLALALAPILGTQVRPERWHSAAGCVILVPGALPDPEPDAPAEAATDPVRRAQQSLPRLLGKDGDNTRSEITDHHDDGTPREFMIRHDTTAKTASEENQRKISTWLAAMLPAARGGRGWKVVVEPQHNLIRCLDQRAMPTRVLHPGDVRDCGEPGRMLLPVGQDEDERALGFDCSASTMSPHGLIVGPTGTGKTSLIRSVIAAAAMHGIEMWGIDPKRIEMLGFTDWPGFAALAVDVEAMRSLIAAAYREMFDRYERIERREVRRAELPPLLVILDEYLILRSMLAFAWKQQGNKGQPPEFEMLTNMLALARSARMHLLLGVQRPDAELFDKGARDNLRFRVSLGQLSAEGADMLWENRQVGTTPTGINGRGVATGRDGMPADMQAWWTPSLDPHPHAREELSPAESDRVELLRSLARVPAGGSSWSTTASGLAIPDSATADERGAVPAGGAEEAMADVVDVLRARDLCERPPMRVKLYQDGDLVYAVVELAHQEEPDGPVELQIRPDGGSGETLELPDDASVWVVDDDLVPA